MNRFSRTLLIFSLLFSCKAIPKFELPTEGSPKRITYLKEVPTSLSREQNYDNLMKEVLSVSPTAKMINTDRTAGNLEAICRSVYHLDGKERRIDYLLSCSIDEKKATVKISGINILHVYLEKYYLDDKRHTIKKFNPIYKEINGICLSMLESFSNQLK